MDALTIHEAAETTGWSPRMLRYIERVGLIEAPRSGSGYRLYGAAELQRLRTLRELLAEHDVGLGDVGFALRLRRDADLRDAVEALARGPPERPDDVPASDWLRWEQDKHEKLLAAGSPAAPDPLGDRMSTTAPQTATDFKVADLSLAELRPQRDPSRRARDARPDGDPRGVRRLAAAQGRAHHGLAAHDDPDGGPHRDARRARRRGPLGLAATSSPPRTTPPPRSPSVPTARPRIRRASPSSPGRARRSRSTGGAPSRR